MSLDHAEYTKLRVQIGNAERRQYDQDAEEIPAFVKVLTRASTDQASLADDFWDGVQDVLNRPTSDPREDWESIAYDLAGHELLSTGGLCVDEDCQNWQPVQYHADVLNQFVSDHFAEWPQGDRSHDFALRDARCILFQEKYNLLQRELSSQKKKAHSQKKTKQPEAFRLINREISTLQGPIDNLELDAIVRRLSRKIGFSKDLQAFNYLVEGLAQCEHIHLGKRDARKLVDRIVKEQAKANRPVNQRDAVPIVNEWSDHEMADFAQDRLSEQTDLNGDPVVYHFNDDVCDLRDGTRRMLTEAQFAAVLDTHTRWARRNGEGDLRGEFAPKQIVKHNFHRSEKKYPVLSEVKSSPFFTSTGRRVDVYGYDEPSETFLDFDLDVPTVSSAPSMQEVIEAKTLIIDEMMGDFPFEGIVDREERMERALNNKPGTVPMPSVAHAVCMCLERSVRDVINGPTPVYAPTKPLPGTGAGRLIGAATLAATGRKAAAEPMPTSDEEYAKVMGAHISQSAEFAFFDNMNAALTLGSFASNVSEGRVRTRLLGSSRMIEADVRHTWIAAANNIKGTSEILRRMVMIELDAKTPNPEKRSGFRHADLEAWVADNRPKLVWAILTLVQNWIAKGMKPWTGKPKASFEAWSRVMGGILRDAEIRGFLENEDRLRSYGSTGGDSGLEVFIQHLATHHSSGALFRAGGTSEIRGRMGDAVYSIKDELNRADDGKPLLLDGWGYNREDGQYNHARGISSQFREAARRAYEVTLFESERPVRFAISFTEEPDPQSPKQFYWEMTKDKVN